MPNVDWSDVFGPMPSRGPTNNELRELDDTLESTLPFSTRATTIQRRLIGDDTFSRIESPAAHRVLEEAEEAKIISDNADAMLQAVEKILEERRAKRLQEESKAEWNWSGAKLARLPALALVRSNTQGRRGNVRSGDLLGVQQSVIPSRTQSARNRILPRAREHQQEVKSVHSEPATWAQSTAGPVDDISQRQRFQDPSSIGLPDSPVPSTSSKYSRSTDDSRLPTTVIDKVPSAWVWPRNIARVSSCRPSAS